MLIGEHIHQILVASRKVSVYINDKKGKSLRRGAVGGHTGGRGVLGQREAAGTVPGLGVWGCEAWATLELSIGFCRDPGKHRIPHGARPLSWSADDATV